MADLTIKKFPDSVLRKKAIKVDLVSDNERKVLAGMAETMYLNHGVGLAAVQVGINKQLAVVDVGDGLIKMINPSILKKEGRESQEEGCLSVPEVVVNVKRAKNIVVNYLNEEGEVRQLRAEGLLSRAIQHEIDHLAGMLIIDYLNPIERLFLRRKKASKKLDKTRAI